MPDALIGPNAITQVVAAARDQLGPAQTNMMLRKAGLRRYILRPPTKMVPEAEVVALHSALAATGSGEAARSIASDAGTRTAEYLLKNRIPPAAGFVLRYLPARLSAGLLLKAISHHAWTFAGSGTFDFSNSKPARISICGSPLFEDTPAACLAGAYYRHTFERLFQKLVHHRCHCREAGSLSEEVPRGGAHFVLSW